MFTPKVIADPRKPWNGYSPSSRRKNASPTSVGDPKEAKVSEPTNAPVASPSPKN